MWHKKTISAEAEQSSSGGLALRPATAHTDAGPYRPFDMDVQKEQPVNTSGRSHRLLWFLGVVLLVGTALGAAWGLNNGTGHADGPGSKASPPPTPPGIVALGIVDNEPRIRNLSSPVAGQVVAVAPEGKLVKKGDFLLRLDSQYALARVKEAEAALQNARSQHELAKLLPLKHAVDIKNQQNAIGIVEHKRDAMAHELDATRETYQEKIIKKRVLDAAEATFKAMEGIIEGEKNKLRILKLGRPDLEVERAKDDVDAKDAQLRAARLALEKCDLPAPEAGTVLRVFVNPGEMIGTDAKFPAIQFCPTGKRIIRAEVLQEWAAMVEKGQKAVIEDDTRAGPKWSGTVTHVSDWITQKRNVMLEPFMVNDVRTLECLIDVTPGGPPLRMGQRVRVTIQQGK